MNFRTGGTRRHGACRNAPLPFLVKGQFKKSPEGLFTF